MKIISFLGFLLLSEMAAVALFVFCLMVLHFNPFGFNVNLILSVGGIVFGFIAGSGSLPGARRAGIAPSFSVMAFVALVTGVAVLAYYYAIFVIFVARLGPAASGVGFGEFFDATVGHTRFSAHYSSASSDIGKWGYGLFILHVVWAMGASVAWLTKLRHAPHCRKCGRYFEERERRELMFASPGSLQELASSLPNASAERAFQLLKMPQTPRYAPELGVARLEIRHAQCPDCHEHDATETSEIHNGKTYSDTETLSYRWRQSGAYCAAPGIPTPQPAAAQPRGFGRRGLD
jgi:hypothetical protein